MINKITTLIAILIGSFMIAGTILYTNGNISNPIIGTAHASFHEDDILYYLRNIRSYLQKIEMNTR